ncbi:fumarylacetoacetate hydrolase family protein [Rhabdothermincola salaria]|uniref:fumarylacetoacetate hydrolase family protein n=1 Tax=Rhabdothermincola salaria TaxID=2903142 RepID=UPI001E6024BB|nr:fumarylacetoacetate hydrolase family protein [Rhabdothermincola salaria]MCD9624862.1 fumarylacetoacetate hydrolase family protein [Rhabdothermincola salaria]
MFRLATLDGRAALVGDDAALDLADLTGDPALADPMTAVTRHGELHRHADALSLDAPGARPVHEVTFGVPVPRPSKVFGIGLNYRTHAAETGAEVPPAPLTFTKFPSCLAPATADIPIEGPTTDWEVELVVVIGTGGRHIPRDQGWRHVAGLCLGQDISERTLQNTGARPQFSLAKSFDGFGPLGPFVVSPDTFADRDDIEIGCAVDGEEVQRGRTSDLIFAVEELVAYLSSICTLTPGDLVFTGTPSGVGLARGRFLSPGAVLTSWGEGLGTMRNQCVAPGRSPSDLEVTP